MTDGLNRTLTLVKPPSLDRIPANSGVKDALRGPVVQDRPLAVREFLSLTSMLVPALARADLAHHVAAKTFKDVLKKSLDLQGMFESETDRFQISQAVNSLTGSWLGFEPHLIRRDWCRIRSGRGSLRRRFHSRDAAEKHTLMENAILTPTCDTLRNQEVPAAMHCVTHIIDLLGKLKLKVWRCPGEVITQRRNLFALHTGLEDLSHDLAKVEFERLGAAMLARLVLQG